jgi:hypothetical protein
MYIKVTVGRDDSPVSMDTSDNIGGDVYAI